MRGLLRNWMVMFAYSPLNLSIIALSLSDYSSQLIEYSYQLLDYCYQLTSQVISGK